MSFNGDGQKFVGDDGFVQNAAFGAEITGDAITPLPIAVYLVITVAAVSTLPAAAGTGEPASPGDILVLKTGDSITPAVGDDLVTLTLTDQCDLSSWTMGFSKPEIDVSTLCDAVKKYRAGKADMSGGMNGVFTGGTTDAVTGKLREFIDVVRQDGDVSFDRYAQQENILLGFFYINQDTNIADKMYVVAPFQMYGQNLGGEMGSAQSFSSAFRFANLTYTNAPGATATIQPTFYRLGDGS